MRRLIFAAIVLVFLVVIGLGFARVTTSGAFVIRDRAMRIHPGLTRADVLEIMADLDKHEAADSWVIGSYSLTVFYETDAQGRTHPDPACSSVAGVFVSGPRPKTLLDRALEFLGYRRLSEIKSYC